MSKRIWIRESDAPEGDAIYLRRADEGVTLDCPICGGGHFTSEDGAAVWRYPLRRVS